jgi:hypothetical protein
MDDDNLDTNLDNDIETLNVGGDTDDLDAKKEDRGDDFVPDDGEGDDTVTGGAGASGDDTISGAAGDDTTTGASGDDTRVPKSRFNEVITQRNDLKKELEEANRLLAEATAAKPGGPTAAAPDTGKTDDVAAPTLKQLRAQHREALMDGDLEKAELLDDQIDAVVTTIATNNALQLLEAKQLQTKTVETLTEATSQALTDFPYLDTAEGAEALDLIVMSRDRKIAAGIPAAQALREAVSTIAPRFKPADGEGGGTDPDKGLNNVPTPKDTRTAAALARGAADSTLQPPAGQAGIGNRTTAGRVDVSKMSEDQFENLPDAEKKRLRGDF